MTKAKIEKEINRLYSEMIVHRNLPKAYQTGMKLFKAEVVNFISTNFSVSGSLVLLEGEVKKIEDYFENNTYEGGVTPIDNYKARRREKLQKAIALIKEIEANDH